MTLKVLSDSLETDEAAFIIGFGIHVDSCYGDHHLPMIYEVDEGKIITYARKSQDSTNGRTQGGGIKYTVAIWVCYQVVLSLC